MRCGEERMRGRDSVNKEAKDGQIEKQRQDTNQGGRDLQRQEETDLDLFSSEKVIKNEN